jgi:hypothetical protein
MPTKIISTLAIIAGASLLALASTASADVLDNIKKPARSGLPLPWAFRNIPSSMKT